MATYLYWTGGDNSSGTEASGWAAAKNTLAGAIALATSAGDIIKVHKTSQENVSGTTTFTFLESVSVICVDKDNSDALAVMGTGGWVGHNTTNYSIVFAGAFKVRINGLTVRNAGSLGCTINNSDGGHFYVKDFYHWQSSTTASPPLVLGNVNNSYTFIDGITVDMDRTSGNVSTIVCGGTVVVRGLVLDAVSSVGAALLTEINSTGSCNATFIDSNFSSAWASALIHNSVRTTGDWSLIRCKLPSNAVLLATQTHSNLSGHRVVALDCSSGDTHGIFRYQDAFGSIVSDSTIYFTAGSAAQSWKIVTTANCSHATPFVTPWIPVYHTGTSAITPRFEILRDGSTTAYQNDEIGAEFSAKVTSGSVIGTTYSDCMPLLGTAADQDTGAGLGSWTGESGTAWSGKIDAGSALTPAENGEILGRALVGEPSITVYLDPEIRW